jgi:glutaminyl-peptide cyclotransferase
MPYLKANRLAMLAIGLMLALAVGIYGYAQLTAANPSSRFDGQKAYQNVQYQEKLGPRIPGTQAHAQTIDWITTQLRQNGWSVQIVESTINGLTAKNILAKRGTGPIVMLGAHFDTRRFADQNSDTSKRTEPVPGANDGASGVAVLLELGRTLPKDLNKEIWLVFFDLEDQGGIQGRAFIEGSTAFAISLTQKPQAVVILDMIGDTDLNIFYEHNSSKSLMTDIWNTAASLGYAKSFIQTYKYSMIDDHTPFLTAGIPAVDLIDFDYPYWHTSADTSDKLSAHSLLAIGDTIWTWLQR